MVNGATGFDYTFNDLMEIGERSVQLQRKLYLAQGGTDEVFLQGLSTEVPAGPSKGAKINQTDFENARIHYYKIMGWDDKGNLKKDTMERFGI